MNVSVIVPAYNAQRTIGQTLQALAEQDYPEKFEVIVVDDGSTDQTAKIIRSFIDINYLHQPNAGPAAARNYGAQNSKGKFLVFTDSDCVPHKDWISKLMQGFVAADVAVVMGSYGIANPENNLADCVYKEIIFRHKWLLSDFPKVFGSYNFCVKRSVFEQVGGFEISYRNASGEDNDLSYKIISSGWRIYFERKALVDHYHPIQVQKYLKEQFRHGFWRARMYLDHPLMTKGDGYTFGKDIVEVPWSLLFLGGGFLMILGLMSFRFFISLFLFPFLIFEVLFSWWMIKDVNKVFLWGFVMFLRSFSRTFGLSTGFLAIFGKKKINKP